MGILYTTPFLHCSLADPTLGPRSNLPHIGEDVVASVGRAAVFFKEDHSDRSRSYLDCMGDVGDEKFGGRALAG